MRAVRPLLMFLALFGGALAADAVVAPAQAQAQPQAQAQAKAQQGEAPAVERVAVPGTIVSLTPPEGYVLAAGFSGFQSESGGSFLVNELPAEAAGQLGPVFSQLETAANAFKARQVTLSKAIDLSGEAALAAYEPRVYAGRQTVGAAEFQKWVGAYRGASFVMVTFQAPPGAALAEETLRDAFASVRLSAALSVEEQAAALPYEVGETGELRLVRILPNGGSIYTIGPKDVDPESEQPLAIVAPSIGSFEVPEIDRKAVAESLLRRLPDVEAVEIESAEVSKADADGVSTVVLKAVVTKSKRRMRILQWMRFAEKDYLRAVAQAPLDRWVAAEPSFTALISGLRLR